MNSSMINAINSMNAYQNKINTISDNVANQYTVGYKSKSAVFDDLLTTTKAQPEGFDLDGRLSPLGFTQGWGSRVTGIAMDFTQGSLNQTGVLTDMAIEGDALFEVIVDNAGTKAYTRDGSFQISMNAAGQGVLTTSEGYPVSGTLADGSTGPIIIPNGYEMQVQTDGTVLAVNNSGTITVGSINMVKAVRPDAMTAISDNLYAVSAGLNVDEVVARIIPNGANKIAVRQGYLEQSNVDMATQMTDLVRVQRAYQLAARALSSSDTMMQLANNLRS
ncbi:MAG: flagellar hook-basal body protein [Candidatus Pristimantibacillus lignocellulolyticus]|uniref:Flagellar hook-basal body protein n=1 Tax=Candidatus Pristimantibacillus lignocellulolyticus TaxID=2994561 RepID=A0A9J6ZJ49_9BACL|nr:MAG: flagellar hook-basal body protein [Candidatus Pristimantibacillus lignocellulolyticus]